MARTQSITLRIPVGDMEKVRAFAEQKGLPYQTCIKMLLHEALHRERNSSSEVRGASTEHAADQENQSGGARREKALDTSY